MNGNDVALDTSAAVKLLNDAAFAARFLSQVNVVYLSAIAAGELLYGAMNSVRQQENVPRYRAFINQCSILPVSLSTADLYGKIRLQLKVAGLPIPDSDIWIGAAAIEKSLPLATFDKHFSSIPNLRLLSV